MCSPPAGFSSLLLLHFARGEQRERLCVEESGTHGQGQTGGCSGGEEAGKGDRGAAWGREGPCSPRQQAQWPPQRTGQERTSCPHRTGDKRSCSVSLSMGQSLGCKTEPQAKFTFCVCPLLATVTGHRRAQRREGRPCLVPCFRLSASPSSALPWC